MDKGTPFTLNEQTVYPVLTGNVVTGYVLEGREQDVIEWEDLGAVTVYTRDQKLGLVPDGLC